MSEVILAYANEQEAVPIAPELVEQMKAAIGSVLDRENLEGSFEVSLTMVDKPTIQQLNAQHRGIDRETDVLSFPLGEGGDFEMNYTTGAKLLGDIVICAPVAVEQALAYGHSRSREFAFLCAHSTLHLLGYDHEGDAAAAAQMEQKQEAALAAVGLTRESEENA